MAKVYTFKFSNFVLLIIGVAYIYLAFALIDARTIGDCKECDRSKKNFIPIEIPETEEE
ncbi:MAG TPA: hypothetical protein VN207_00995 [Ktedonobacteraceae bacterium]|nr:hypothetical protein [Ktedonobacteraceae bacterium]